MRKEDKKVLVVISCIAIIFVIVGFGIFYNAPTSSTWIKTYRLNDQFIASIPTCETSGLVPCNDCLVLEVQDEWWTPGELMTENLTFFFANEHELRSDLQLGGLINVRWKRVDGKTLIRRVWKAGEAEERSAFEGLKDVF
ncbi:hypothetical protein KAW18_02365 [candidate division WOR-3 bacterium]|nr:hypothetical protein [candidate division WOR-3 bacterium]